jgi:cystathionine beta-lyase/cystathionine gamma-synthase
MKPQTTLVHAGDRRKLGDYIPVSTPVYASSSFFYDTMEELADVFADRRPGETYSRMGNPSTSALEEQVAALEGTDCAFATASGMAAVHLAIIAGLLDRRQSIVAANVLYGGSLELLRSVLRPSGIEVRFCDFCDLDAVEQAVRQVRPALLITETVSNPCLRVADLDRVSEIAKANDAWFLVDNTFTPLLMKPFEHGADMVIHSATKYLGGHGDVLAGLVAAPEQHHEALRQSHRCLGGNLGPFEAFLVMRGVKTLPLRMRRHCSNARTVYEALKDHPAIERLLFPGDPSHPDAEAVKKLLPPGQAGGAIGIDVRGGEEGAYGFVDRLQLVATSASIGDLTTLALHPASATHRMLSAEARAALGITDGLVRLSIGAEDIDDILADLRQALEAA